MFFMIIFSLMVYGLINFYVGARILLWLKVILPVLPSGLFWFIYGFLALSIFIGYSIPVSSIAKTIHLISNFWMGVFLYLLLVIAFIDVLCLASKYTTLGTSLRTAPGALIFTGMLALLIVLGSVIYGLYTSSQIKIKEYDLTIHKDAGALNTLNVVLISDVHLGYTIGEKHVSKIVAKINMLDADLVCIAGDIFDNHFASIDDIEAIIKHFRSLKAAYGVYACLGNHDVERPKVHLRGKQGFKNNDTIINVSAEMMDFFKRAEVTLLQDEVILVNNSFYVAGRVEAAPIGVIQHSRKPIGTIIEGVDKSKPILVMDHRPIELTEVEASGADLLMSGHTHQGQVFPGNLVTKRIFEVDYGHKQKGPLHSIVTSGVGTWGPPLRLGTQSEVVCIHVTFNK